MPGWTPNETPILELAAAFAALAGGAIVLALLYAVQSSSWMQLRGVDVFAVGAFDEKSLAIPSALRGLKGEVTNLAHVTMDGIHRYSERPSVRTFRSVQVSKQELPNPEILWSRRNKKISFDLMMDLLPTKEAERTHRLQTFSKLVGALVVL